MDTGSGTDAELLVDMALSAIRMRLSPIIG